MRVRRTAAAVLCLMGVALVLPSNGSAVEAGADISWLPRNEEAGAIYKVQGQSRDPIELLADNDLALIRLRLWHTPSEHWQGLESTLDFAERVAAAGCDVMLDIHYSDTWADPGHQTKPAAWEGIPFEGLVDSVYAYTNKVVRSFRDRGVPLRYVQIGNEISGGMLWDDGRVGGAWDTPEQWAHLCALLSAGAAAARDSLPTGERPGIVIHVDNGSSNTLCRWFFDKVAAGGVHFDVIGVSFYPWWHGTLSELDGNLRDLSARYGKRVMVVETAYPWTLGWCDDTHNPVGLPAQLHGAYPATPQGQTAFLSDLLGLVEAIPDSMGAGLIYWEPMAVCVNGGPGSSWENLALFDFQGNALPALGFVSMVETSVEPGEFHGGPPLFLPAEQGRCGAPRVPGGTGAMVRMR
ncbi:MAG: glycosyl hydrolase 53 family protein [Armatimonadetes bacterium]|nr:glycosyl hydrolase 53 family protein [Armatimonadota bacterium]